MRKCLVASSLLLAILVTVGLTGRSRPVVSSPAGGAKLGAGATQPVEQGRAGAAVGNAVVVVESAVTPPMPMTVKAVPSVLTEDETGLLAATCELQLMADGTALELSSEQWSALAEVALDVQAIRQTYEAQIATVTEVSPGRHRVEVPVYAQMGDALRERFQASLRVALGEPAAGAVVDRLGAKLEGYFAGFGVSVQTLEIVGDARGSRADFEVTRTVDYWDSVEGRDELTTRRETHLPAWEDPAGERWGALLARIGT